MKYVVLIFCILLATAVKSVAEEKTIAFPAPPNAEIGKGTALIYCDAILGTILQSAEKDHSKSATPERTLKAAIDKPKDRLVIEISDQTLYVHHREEFEKGMMYGHMCPYEIVKSSTKQEIIASGHCFGTKATIVAVFSLNRATGVGLWTLSRDSYLPGSLSLDSPSSTAMYLSCGNRKE